jgi:hypothetical protein
MITQNENTRKMRRKVDKEKMRTLEKKIDKNKDIIGKPIFLSQLCNNPRWIKI